VHPFHPTGNHVPGAATGSPFLFGEPTMLYPTAVALRKIRTARNPRTYFDSVEMAGITESIRASGVYQPILHRPIEDDEFDFELVAGEQRYRGVAEANGLAFR
ncbi:ParB N-terminal domain-containing protein, partial [Cupriavidus necator]